MDPYVTEHLEAFLSGQLAGARRREFATRLERDPSAAKLVADFVETTALFQALRPEGLVGPAPGFYLRVRARIDEERQTPFWMVFLEPFMMRRLAFASLMWLFLLGSVTLVSDLSKQPDTKLADMMLSEDPPTEHFNVRLGADLDQNRTSMLAVMMASGD